MKKLLRKWLLKGAPEKVVRIENPETAVVVFRVRGDVELELLQYLQDALAPSLVVVVPEGVSLEGVIERRMEAGL